MIGLFRSIFPPPRHLILLLAALWIGLALAEKRAERHDISRDALNNIVYYSLFGYILGGRLLYALANFSAFVESPLSIFSLNLDLFDPLAGLAGAIVVGLIYGSRQKMRLWTTLDALTPLVATVMVGIPLANLAAGTAFGSPTNLPWAIELWNATRHPTQLYELGASLAILGLVWLRKADSSPGTAFLSFLALTSGARLFFEAFRGDSSLIAGGLRLPQIVAWGVLAAALILSEWARGRNKSMPQT